MQHIRHLAPLGGLVAFMMIPGGAMQISQNPMQAEGFAKLGYPLYFMVMLGVWKILAGSMPSLV